MAGWVSPTGHEDPSNDWDDDIRAYDDDLGTYAEEMTDDSYLVLTHAALDCDKIQVNARTYYNKDPDCVVDVYYSSVWHNIYDGVISKGIWVELTIGSTESVTKARIRSDNGGTDWIDLYELDFNEVEAPPVYIPQVIMIQFAKINNTYRRLKNLWIPQLKKLWLPTPPVCAPKGIMVQ